jgi:prophage regulatory protein
MSKDITSPYDDDRKHSPKPVRLLRLPEVVHRSGLPRASIYEQMAQGLFPKPVALSTRSRGWIEYEIEEWIAARIRFGRPNDGSQ